eukprot:TRINITY_DN893_c0_g2_i1.p1 TRINITY_DN893_c0_g2~~TRINITY_DN893_c0_g2_i1.p1  ORF type:complete len:240 (+),score=67.63 TRINITY_DN893_c0_g2_i1:56-775(+)
MSTKMVNLPRPVQEEEEDILELPLASPSDAPPSPTHTCPTALEKNLALAATGVFPALCTAHFRGTCPHGDQCPLMHSVNDKRFALTLPDVKMPVVGSQYKFNDGTTSLILPSEAACEVTNAQVADYADWMGMDLETEGGLSWIARQAMAAPVLAPWRQCRTSDGESYYFNFATKESSWDHPMDGQIKEVHEEEKALLAVRRREARGLVMAYRRVHGGGFYCLVSEMVSWVVSEPRAFEQ